MVPVMLTIIAACYVTLPALFALLCCLLGSALAFVPCDVAEEPSSVPQAVRAEHYARLAETMLRQYQQTLYTYSVCTDVVEQSQVWDILQQSQAAFYRSHAMWQAYTLAEM